MKFFNIDQHISVIADIKHIFSSLGHTVEDKTLSGHAHIMGRNVDDIPELNGDKWCGTLGNQDKIDAFYAKYKDMLDKYDGFICTYPPLFAKLFERTGKPIIIQAPIRFDYTLENNAEAHKGWCEWLASGVDRGQIILCANNRLDQEYMEAYVGRPVTHLPSLCEYTGMQYDYKNIKFNLVLYYASRQIPYLLTSRFGRKYDMLQHGYPWEILLQFNGIVHFPYQISTMSIFEQYTANIPLFFPSKQFITKLYNENLVALKDMVECHRTGVRYWDENNRLFILDQVSFYEIFNREPKSVRMPNLKIDPNNYFDMATVKWWIDRADYYDEKWMPAITYFDGYEDLNKNIREFDYEKASKMMAQSNKMRKEAVYSKWTEIINNIK